MSHCITNQLYRIEDAPIAQGRVEYNAGMYTIFLDQRLKEVSSDTYDFLHLQGKKMIDITQKGVSEENKSQMQKNAIKQIAAGLTVFAVGLNYYSMNYFPAGLASLPVWFLACKLKNCADERIKAKEVDVNLIEEASPETLKGGILFYKAWQRVNQKKDPIFFTNSGESRFSVLESTPALEGRITQLKKKLESLEKPWECTEANQKTIKKIEKLF
ncbi:MAG: hypothetical protein WBD50_06440 [Candidatus Rhabdochlamydia sp.]|mgnify:CR=1 FL=1